MNIIKLGAKIHKESISFSLISSTNAVKLAILLAFIVLKVWCNSI